MSRTRPTLVIIPKWVERRLISFDMKTEDVLDIEKMSSILSPDEMILYYTGLQTYPVTLGISAPILKLASPSIDGKKCPFDRFSPYSAASRIINPEYRKRFIDTLESSQDLSSSELGRSLAGENADLPNMVVEFNVATLDLVTVTFKESVEGEPEPAEQDIYNLYHDVCTKIHQYYGFREVVATDVFLELDRLSRLS